MHVRRAHPLHVLRSHDARLGHHQALRRNPRQQAQRGIERHLESAQVTVVDAQQRGLQLERRSQFLVVVHLDQHVHAEVKRASFQFRHQAVVQCRHDQQDRIRAHRARLVHLVMVDDEILADHRQRAGGARLAQVGFRALEELHVGQHRQAGRAVFGVALRDRRRLEVRAQHAFRGRGLLHFRDDAGPAGSDLVAQAVLETADGAARFQVALHLAAQAGQVARFFRRGHFVGLDGQDLVQDVGHRTLNTLAGCFAQA